MRSIWNERGLARLTTMARKGVLTAMVAALPAVVPGVALLWPTAAWAVPSQVTLEGALLSSGGGAAPDGTYNVVFAIYKDVSGGNPIWSEGPVAVAVKNGLFQYSIGTKTALTPAALANLATAFIGMKVEADAELPRQQLLSTAYALRAGIAEGVDCSGCIGAAALDPNVLAAYAKATDLAAYAKTTDLGAYAKTASLKPVATTGAYSDLSGAPVLAPVATSGKYSDLSGGPDLTPYVKASALKAIATTGAYADLSGAPVLAKVATTGSYFDMVDEPVPVKLGAACGTGLVMKGIKADGSYDCAAGGGGPIDVKNLPADGIDEISNGLIFNQFNDTFSGVAGTKIPDNFPTGVADTIAYPDIGLSQKLTVTVDVTNSDVSGLTITLTDPNLVDYVLYKKGATGTAVKTSYPAPTLPVSGDLTTWIGKNPVGKWTIKVVDSAFLNNTFDGQINSWSITSQTLSSKKIAIAGNLLVAGSVKMGADAAACDASKAGAVRWTGSAMQVCNGSAWTFMAGNDGSSKGAPSKNCKQLHNDYPTFPDGIYWIDPNGGGSADAFQAPCNMSRVGGGWTMGVKAWYQSGVAGTAGALGTIGDAMYGPKGGGWKLSDQQIKDVIGTNNNFDVMLDESGHNSAYSTGNYEYVIILNYTGVWTFAANVAPSATTTSMYSYRMADNAVAWSGNFGCGDVGGWGINCYNITAGANPQGGAGCALNMGTASNSGWHHIYMSETNTDTYLYMCNGPQHSSSYNDNHRFWFREH